MIIDTKYKILEDTDDKKKGVFQQDMYQMYAYSKKYKCPNIIMLYPKTPNQEDKNIKICLDLDSETINTNVFIRTIDLYRDLIRKYGELREELGRILKE